MAIRIIPYEESLWPRLAEFLHEHWQANHPLCHKPLFDWQYRGFGPLAVGSACRVAMDDERVLGFLGAIPGLYRLDGRDVPGVALALWVVVEEMRNSGLGMLLMRDVEKQGEVTVCLGVNPKVARYYTATGYRHLGALHRYVRPLEAEGYCLLLNDPAEPDEIQQWARLIGLQAATPRQIDPKELAALWRTGQDHWRLSLARNEEFWAWRYRDTVGFEYHYFGTEEQGGIVARLDRISEADKPELEGRAVLRIIEIVPGCGPGDVAGAAGIAAVLAGVLAWARQQGAVAADFQCSSRGLEPWLAEAGFRRRDGQDRSTHLPEVFCPLRRAVAPINLMAKAKGWTDVDFDAVYCVKSDGDMDRPVRSIG